MTEITVEFRPKTFLKIILAVVAVLFGAAFIAGVFDWAIQSSQASQPFKDAAQLFSSIFSLDREQNLPTWYSSLSLLLCAGLLGFIAVARQKSQATYLWHWRILSAIFILLAFDEFASIHEKTYLTIKSIVQFRGFFYFSWILIGIPFVAVLALLYFRWWWDLPSRTRWLFLLAAVVYLGGAVGVEMLEGYVVDLYGVNRIYLILTFFEEFGELTGVAIFLFGLLDYIVKYLNTFYLKISFHD